MKKIVLTLTMLTSSLACFAGTAGSAGCDLEIAKAHAQSDVAKYPKLIASVGDGASGSKNTVVGVSQSIAGLSQAKYIDSSAGYKCKALQAMQQYEEYITFAESNVSTAGLKVQLPLIEKALDMAQHNVEVLLPQLNAKTITMVDYMAAKKDVASLQLLRSDILKKLSAASIPVDPINLNKIALDVIEAESEANSLYAKAQASHGWDIGVSAGIRKPYSGVDQTTQSFVALSANYSFGYRSAMTNANRIKELTTQYMENSNVGMIAKVEDLKTKFKAIKQADESIVATLTTQISELKSQQKSIESVNSVLALNILRKLQIEELTTMAEKEGAEARLKMADSFIASF